MSSGFCKSKWLFNNIPGLLLWEDLIKLKKVLAHWKPEKKILDCNFGYVMGTHSLYAPSIYAEGYIVFAFTFVHTCVPFSWNLQQRFPQSCVKVSQVGYISQTTHQKAFIFIPPPPAKRSVSGVYCFQHVRNSVIPSANKVLYYNFNTFCPIFTKFTPHLHHHTMHMWLKNKG